MLEQICDAEGFGEEPELQECCRRNCCTPCFCGCRKGQTIPTSQPNHTHKPLDTQCAYWVLLTKATLPACYSKLRSPACYLEVAGRAKPYPKVILERRKHLFGSFAGCELHSGPPIALLPTAHASCLHPQAPQSACQTIPKSNFGASKTSFRITQGV